MYLVNIIFGDLTMAIWLIIFKKNTDYYGGSRKHVKERKRERENRQL